MRRLWMAAAMAACALLAQESAWQDLDQIYTAYREATLAGAAEVVTVQQAASPAKTIHLDAASVYCSVDCVVTIERNGTAATTTALLSLLASGEVSGDRWTFTTEGQGVKSRLVLTLGPKSYSGITEVSRDGSWTPFSTIKATRVTQ